MSIRLWKRHKAAWQQSCKVLALAIILQVECGVMTTHAAILELSYSYSRTVNESNNPASEFLPVSTATKGRRLLLVGFVGVDHALVLSMFEGTVPFMIA